MDGSAWVGLAGVATAFATTVFTMRFQRSGERERRQEEHTVRRDQKWIDLRREVYTQFLRGADECARTLRARFAYLRFEGFDNDDDRTAVLDRLNVTGDGIQLCSDALAEMRLFAPADVSQTAVLYLAHARALEYFTGNDIALAGMPGQARTDVDEPYGTTVNERDKAINDLVGAMRADLGAEATETVELSNLDPTIYGC